MDDNEILDGDLTENDYKPVPLIKATTNHRLANFIIDRIGLVLFVFFVAVIAEVIQLEFVLNMFQSVHDNFLMDYLLTSFLGTAYYTIFEYNYGKSPAKFVTRTTVLMVDGQRPDLNTILGRSLARFIPFEPFSFLGGRSTGWHDSMTQTQVVQDESLHT